MTAATLSMTRHAHTWMGAVSLAATKACAGTLSPAGRGARLAVFSYHQVLERRDPLRPGEPDRSDFASDVEIIRQMFSVLPLQEAAARLTGGTLPSRAACVTFDDGYANNHELAASVLEAHGVPATFFVTGGAVDDGVMWNDLLIEAVAARGNELVLSSVPGLDTSAFSASQGPALVAEILQALKYRPLSERRTAAEQVYRDNVGPDLPRLMMTREMVADLARRGFDIGGHTMNHPILAQLPEDEARLEISSCSQWIEDVTGRRPKTFAYPNGRPGKDFTAVHAAMVGEAGYDVAVSTSWDLARTATDVYNVPRIGPWWRQQRSLPGGLLRLYVRSYLS
jgi:peptidoglycan/xylan/chitin deacetylase (PgdA/CDA1 family)